MAALQYRIVDVTTDGAGDATAYSGQVTGMIQTIKYVADGTSPFAATADFTITTESSAQDLWVEANVTATKIVYPRAATHDTAGVAALYAAGGTNVRTPIYAVSERIKIVIAQGGAATLGRFIIVVGS